MARRKTDQELIVELRQFHHYEAAARIEWMQKRIYELTSSQTEKSDDQESGKVSS
jgi:hypothetical protein